MHRRLVATAFVAALAVWGLAMPAHAHPQLVSATPSEGGTARNVTQLSITFSQPLVAATSGVDLLMTAMPGMDDHQPMKMSGVKTSVAPDGVTLLARLARPLPAGTYQADWHATSADAHRMTGKVTFTVK